MLIEEIGSGKARCRICSKVIPKGEKCWYHLHGKWNNRAYHHELCLLKIMLKGKTRGQVNKILDAILIQNIADEK